MIALLRANLSRVAVALLVIAIVAGLLWLQSCRDRQSAETRADLAEGQAGAAIESGSDAVGTIGNAQAREAETAATVKEGTDAINAAPAGNSNDAADRAVCRMRAYRNQPRCVALLGHAPK